MTRSRSSYWLTAVAAAMLIASTAPHLGAQAPASQSARPRPEPKMDPERAKKLYVSDNPDDHSPGRDFQRDVDAKKAIDARFAEASKGVMDFQKVTYRSSVGDLDIPAYLFQPLQKRGPHGHAAMIWVHGGVHGNMDLLYFPFIKEAVQRGYVIITPEYRGSTGFGEAFHKAIDYGGHEVEDTMSAVTYLNTLAHVDPDRLGIMGWSHGGFIALHSVFREVHPFKAAAAIVPVTNLVFRLSYKGPGYAARLRDAAAPARTAVRTAGRVHQALTALQRRQAQGAAPRPRRDQRHRRQFRRRPANGGRVALAQSRSGRDEDLCRPAAGIVRRWTHLQPPHRHEDARTDGHARATRFLEPHLGVFRVALAAVRGPIEILDQPTATLTVESA